MPRERSAARMGCTAHARGGQQPPPLGCRRLAGPPAVQLQHAAVRQQTEDAEDFAVAAPGVMPLTTPSPRATEPTHCGHRLRAQEQSPRADSLSTGL